MEQVGISGKWGLFSMGIPGRVGYQCSNYYRHLVESGVIEDPNYELDESGKVHYKGKTRKNKSSRAVHPDEQHSSTKKRKKIGNSSSDSESDDDYKPSYTVLRQQQTEENVLQQHYSNPLPGFIDTITLEEVVHPAISPYGHVLGKETWSRCLSQEGSRNICPFTKRTLHIRDLELITWDNIEEYRHKIVNWP
mmetsp:Transcript_7626/g.9454  ORF Transcript_7626/g.9454 Transcript_7626/m.9454 type:complete len:193 (-) Transcript_7626:53-631(-)